MGNVNGREDESSSSSGFEEESGGGSAQEGMAERSPWPPSVLCSTMPIQKAQPPSLPLPMPPLIVKAMILPLQSPFPCLNFFSEYVFFLHIHTINGKAKVVPY